MSLLSIEATPRSVRTNVSEDAYLSEGISYRIKNNFVSLVDRTIDNSPLAETNFRISCTTLDRMSRLLGKDVVLPLEHAIVQSRFRILGPMIKLAGQTGFTAAFAGGAPTTENLLLLYLLSVGGRAKEVEDRRRVYIEVYQAAVPVIQRLLINHLPDFHRWTDEQKLTFVPEIAEAIARGESLDRVQFGALSYGILNGLALFMTGQPWYSYAGLAVGEAAVIAHQQGELQRGRILIENQQSVRRDTVAVQNADWTFGSHLGQLLLRYLGETDLTKSWTEESWRRIFTRVFIQGGIPYAIATKSLFGLFATIAGQLGVQWLSVDDNRGYFSTAQVGMRKLRNVLDTLERDGTTSLIPIQKLSAHCDNFKRYHNPSADDEILGWLSAEYNKDVIAHIAPFEIHFPDKLEPILTSAEALELKFGIYYVNAPARKGTSALFHALAHLAGLGSDDGKTTEKGETFVRVNSDGASHFQKLHELAPEKIKRLFQYTFPEPEYSSIAPEALFEQDIKYLIPSIAQGNPFVTSILQRFHNDEALTLEEHNAIVECSRYLVGLKTYEEVMTANVSRNVKLVIARLLPYFTPAYGKEIVIEHLQRYKANIDGQEVSLFNRLPEDAHKGKVDDIAEIKNASTHTQLPPSTRAKLRVVRALEKAETERSKIILIDQTLDALPDDETKIFLAYLAEWCRRNEAVMIIDTKEGKNKRFVRETPGAYKGTIFLGKDNSLTLGWEGKKLKN